MPGSKVHVWKQDPSVTSAGIGLLYIHTAISDGPRDSEIAVELPDVVVRSNEEGDFIFDPDRQPLEFDAVHTFATARQILTTYKRILARLGSPRRSLWHWGEAQPLRILPRAGSGYVARYCRENREISLYSFEAVRGRQQGQTVYACRSFDLIAHETGHAILDGLNPCYASDDCTASQVGALREAFADLTVLFGMLAQLDQCERLIVETRGDLASRNYCQVIGEQIGEALHGDRNGVRVMNPVCWQGQEFANQHELSLVFSSAIYEILVQLFARAAEPDKLDPAESLYQAAKELSTIVVRAFLRAYPNNLPTFKDLAREMVPYANPAHRDIFLDEFRRRGILPR